MNTLSIGSKAPDFELPTDRHEMFRPSTHKGRPVVLYFYPEDDTEGCTLENIEFSDHLPEFGKLGAVVVGISPDSVEKHCSFRDRYNLGVILAADPQRKAIEAYGVWQLKKMFGVEYMGVKRTTFLIGPDGTIAGIFLATRIRGHAEKVLAATRDLISGQRQAPTRHPRKSPA